MNFRRRIKWPYCDKRFDHYAAMLDDLAAERIANACFDAGMTRVACALMNIPSRYGRGPIVMLHGLIVHDRILRGEA